MGLSKSHYLCVDMKEGGRREGGMEGGREGGKKGGAEPCPPTTACPATFTATATAVAAAAAVKSSLIRGLWKDAQATKL